MMEGFIFGLFMGDELIDQTSIDEDDLCHAEYLFFTEFGHKKTALHKVELLEVVEDGFN